jgi:tetratricopeptide (TPR) repeat protein
MTAGRLRAAAALLAAALAVALAAIAVDVQAWPDAAAKEDARVGAEPVADGWSRPSGRGEDAARRILDVTDDVAFRRALVLYRRARDRVDDQTRTAGELRESATAEAALALVERSEAPAALRSRAATLEALLLFDDAVYDRQEGDIFLEEALERLRLAIHLDPANTDAKFDLELLLKLARTTRGRFGDSQAGSLGAGESGAGFGQAGSGY